MDPAGVPVAGAVVMASSGDWKSEARTGTDGLFVLALPEDVSVLLVVRAAAFDEVRVSVAAARPAQRLRVTLPLPALSERVTVTAARTREPVAHTPASVVILPGPAIEAGPWLALDDALRQVPGFTLFRRTGSLTANPTAQGVSLRGLGASGTSRALVLDDGVPLNDPFGGWVYWDRLPAILLDRVEIVRGGISDLYGSGAVSGVVNLVRRQPRRHAARGAVWVGSMATARVDGTLALAPGPWDVVGAVEWLRTEGYVPTAPEQRGPIDSAVASRHGTIDLSVGRRIGATARAFGRASLFDESRANGTPFQANDTRSGQAAGGLDAGWFGGQLTLRGHVAQQTFNQTFSAIAPDRRSEQPVRRQQVPTGSAGGSGQWVRSAGRHRVVIGAEGRRVSGTNHEQAWGAGAWQPLPDAGGTQAGGALFASDTIDWSSASLAISIRGDRWRSGPRSAAAFSPRLGATWRPIDRLTLVGAAYRAFRAPTLNELYRSFRLGNIVTLANETLGPERLAGVEAGARFAPWRPVLLSGRAFEMRLAGAVANVTLSSSASAIVRQRQNLGRLSSRGVEFDAEAHVAPRIALRAAYLFDSATVARFASDPTLEGRRLPQQPRHAVTVGALFGPASIGSVTIDARWTGDQFDDDQNRFRLQPCSTLSASWSRAVGSRFDLMVAAENIFDSRCEVGKSPVTQLGPPRAVRFGTRVRWQ